MRHFTVSNSLVRRDLKPAHIRYVQHHQEGEVIHFDRAHKKQGIEGQLSHDRHNKSGGQFAHSPRGRWPASQRQSRKMEEHAVYV
jgi:hypothetical protein